MEDWYLVALQMSEDCYVYDPANSSLVTVFEYDGSASKKIDMVEYDPKLQMECQLKRGN